MNAALMGSSAQVKRGEQARRTSAFNSWRPFPANAFEAPLVAVSDAMIQGCADGDGTADHVTRSLPGAGVMSDERVVTSMVNYLPRYRLPHDLCLNDVLGLSKLGTDKVQNSLFKTRANALREKGTVSSPALAGVQGLPS